jgi:putative heme-binding domain-containing protein
MQVHWSMSIQRWISFLAETALFGIVCMANLHAAGGLGATAPESIRVPAGFKVDLVYEVPIKDQGSWVCMCVDLKGRLIVSDQYGKLYRVQPAAPGTNASETKVEPLDVSVGMAQGLLHTRDGLYVDINGKGPTGGGLYRLQDLDGDDQFEKMEHLIKLEGGGEHGPHAIIPGPDGRLYMCAGNQTSLPAKIDASRVPRIWSEDHMLGRMPDARGFMATTLAPGGFILSMKPDGSDVELVATGFRNEYDIAFNPLGDLFTYDADMEWDVGTPWYRPTRVNHVISGAEFGWRNGTGKWPEYFADSFGAVANIGYGSPTGIAFGTGAKFPAKYQNSLMISDWSYGVVYAVQMESQGSTYKSTVEPFISAAPLPVTDLLVHPSEGCMYVAIGGRRVQSALYRIRYVGSESTAPAKYPDTPEAASARMIRRSLEAMHRGELDVDLTSKYVGSSDRGIRTAARLALEHNDAGKWRHKIASPANAQAAITLAVALSRKGEPSDQAAIHEQLLKLNWSQLNQVEQLELLRAYQLSFLRLGEGSESTRNKVLSHLDSQFPTATEDGLVDRELARLLIYLNAPKIVDRCVARLRSTGAADEQIHYAFCLREVKRGWSDETRKAYFEWFYQVATARGGASFGGFVENIRQVAIRGLTEDQKKSLGELVGAAPQPRDPLADLAPRKTVKEWTVSELEQKANEKKSGFNFESGKQMFAVAQCYKCHRFAGQGGIQGPDLTSAGGRFNTRDMLTAIVEPSKEISDQYAATQFLTSDDQVVVGRVANLNGDVLNIATNMLDPGNFTNIKRGDLVEMRPSKVSMMPTGLLNTLTEDEAIDLLVYLRAGGNPKSELYK